VSFLDVKGEQQALAFDHARRFVASVGGIVFCSSKLAVLLRGLFGIPFNTTIISVTAFAHVAAQDGRQGAGKEGWKEVLRLGME
jgi:hypothetical protein